ncbi:alpha/beta hydrolase, partial [Undibacterium sp.]|uniref:alpha/beta fold hydrolase n=1 Tax=Undibacterium sp. TaxID=1914977 RepID=UPI002C313558
LTMPVLVISGEKSGGTFLIDQVKLVATNVDGKVIPGSGHWLLEEAPEKVIPLLKDFINQGNAG